MPRGGTGLPLEEAAEFSGGGTEEVGMDDEGKVIRDQYSEDYRTNSVPEEAYRKNAGAPLGFGVAVTQGLERDLAANPHRAASTIQNRSVQKVCSVICRDVLVA